MKPYIKRFSDIRITDIDSVGGKNASLGEMISQLAETGITVPDGFATTADAFRYFLKQSNLDDKINQTLDKLDVYDVRALSETGRQIRQWISEATLPDDLQQTIRQAYQLLIKRYGDNASFAVRSSATAEDLPEASFAGQQETYLNIQGEDAILKFYSRACPRLYELDTIAYWIMDKGAHSERLRASINQIAQVAIELSISRGKSALTIRKADKRKPDALNFVF